MKAGTKDLLALAVLVIVIYFATRKPAPPPPPPELANLYGTVTDGATGGALADVQVTMGSLQTATDGGGYYEFLSVEPGSFSVRFSKTGYEEKEMSVTLSAGESKELNVALTRVAPPQNATLWGLVTDAQTGLPLAAVMVEVNGYIGYTNDSGYYQVSNIPPGTYPVTFNLAGYQTLVI